MAASAVRLTLKFNFPQVLRYAGWSEAYDLGYASLATAISSVANINAFILNRCFCLGIGPTLMTATLSAYVQPLTPGAAPIRRNSLALTTLPTLSLTGAYNSAFTTTQDIGYLADFSTTVLYIALQTDLSGTPVYRRSVWLAALPDNSDQTNSTQVQGGPIGAALSKFLLNLSNSGPTLASQNNVSIRSIDRGPGNPIKVCTAWNTTALTFTVPGHGFVVGQPIVAEGCKVNPGGFCPRGRYLVASVPDANTFTLANLVSLSIPIATGGFRAAIVTFNPVTTGNSIGFTKRDKGRPSSLSVGRRKLPLIKRA